MTLPLRLGLTGGIGSGKSTVAALLARCGAVVIDTDAIAHALTQAGGAGIAPIAQAFGSQLIGSDGALDRQQMRALVFADPRAKTRLEGILHPLIGLESQRQAEAANGQSVVFDVPLLTESRHWRQRVERILVVDCQESTQVARVVQRSGWEPEAVRRVIAAQATRSARRAIADAVIDNDALALSGLEAEVDALWRHWHGIA